MKPKHAGLALTDIFNICWPKCEIFNHPI